MDRREFLRGTAAAGCLLALPSIARAEGVTVHLCGDSIFRGYALGAFTPDLDPADPLYSFRSIASMGNMLMAENDAPVRYAYLGFGISSATNAEPNITARAQAAADANIIRAGDFVVFEDAGTHSLDMNHYKLCWTNAIQAVKKPGVRIAAMTTPDYTDIIDSRYSAGNPSANDMIRSAATDEEVPIIDGKAAMDQWKNSAAAVDGVNVMHSDGIHPNVWGQMLLLKCINQAFNLRYDFVRSARTLEEVARANYARLAYGGGPTWDGQRAAVYVRYLLG